jgi:hypothetical protein
MKYYEDLTSNSIAIIFEGDEGELPLGFAIMKDVIHIMQSNGVDVDGMYEWLAETKRKFTQTIQ